MGPLWSPRGSYLGSYVYGAAHQRPTVLTHVDDVEQMWIRSVEVMDLSDPASEVLKALRGGSSRQSLVAPVHPAETLQSSPEANGRGQIS